VVTTIFRLPPLCSTLTYPPLTLPLTSGPLALGEPHRGPPLFSGRSHLSVSFRQWDPSWIPGVPLCASLPISPEVPIGLFEMCFLGTTLPPLSPETNSARSGLTGDTKQVSLIGPERGAQDRIEAASAALKSTKIWKMGRRDDIRMTIISGPSMSCASMTPPRPSRVSLLPSPFTPSSSDLVTINLPSNSHCAEYDERPLQ
jgi:hypothetical protein